MERLCLILAAWLYATCCGAAALAAAPVVREAATPTSSFVNGPCTHTAYPIPNSGFESGLLAPWKVNSGVNQGYYVHLIQPGFNGSSYAALLSVQAPGHSPSIYLENLPVCAATTYRLSFWWESSLPDTNCSTVVAQTVTGYDGEANVVKTQVEFPLTYSYNYSEFSFEFAEYWHTSIGIMVSLVCDPHDGPYENGIGLDHFSLQAVGSLEEPGCPRKPDFTGGDFEHGQQDFIVYDSPHPTSFQVVSPGYQSAHALQINASIGGPAKITMGGQVQTCLDYTYTFSFAYRFVGGNPLKYGCVWAVDLQDCNSSKQTMFHPDGSGNWQLGNFTCLMNLPGDGSGKKLRMQLQCITDSSPTPFTAYVDDVSVLLAA